MLIVIYNLDQGFEKFFQKVSFIKIKKNYGLFKYCYVTQKTTIKTA